MNGSDWTSAICERNDKWFPKDSWHIKFSTYASILRTFLEYEHTSEYFNTNKIFHQHWILKVMRNARNKFTRKLLRNRWPLTNWKDSLTRFPQARKLEWFFVRNISMEQETLWLLMHLVNTFDTRQFTFVKFTSNLLDFTNCNFFRFLAIVEYYFFFKPDFVDSIFVL